MESMETRTEFGEGPREGELTKQLETYTGAIPSSAYLTIAVGAMAASLLFQVAGRSKWGNFIGQWVPTWLLIGLYNKLVKVEGHDRADLASREQPGVYVCEFCESRFSFRDDLENHQKHCRLRNQAAATSTE